MKASLPSCCLQSNRSEQAQQKCSLHPLVLNKYIYKKRKLTREQSEVGSQAITESSHLLLFFSRNQSIKGHDMKIRNSCETPTPQTLSEARKFQPHKPFPNPMQAQEWNWRGVGGVLRKTLSPRVSPSRARLQGLCLLPQLACAQRG